MRILARLDPLHRSYYLNRVDPKVPRDTVGAMARLVELAKSAHRSSKRERKRCAGLSGPPVNCVQSEYSLWSRLRTNTIPPARELGSGYSRYALARISSGA